MIFNSIEHYLIPLYFPSSGNNGRCLISAESLIYFSALLKVIIVLSLYNE